MTPEDWRRIRAIFDEALDQPSSAADEFVRRACGDDEALYEEVRRLIERHRRPAFVDQPPFAAQPAAAGAQPVFHEGQMVAGRYRILRYLNRGGMGEVYEARDLDLELRGTVALKTLLPEIAGDEGMIARFKQEIALSREVAHPNVCKVFDLARHEGEGARPVLFLTMEFLSGETLSAKLRREGAMREAEALPLLGPMAAALDASHDAGVIHRDFKPSNVMLVPAGGGIRVVVTDFGLARRFVGSDGSTASMSKAVVGTLAYMAPELLTGAPAAFASDLYAMGVTAYQMVTGALPFTADSPLAAAVLRIDRPAPSPRALKPGLDERWERAILRALDPKPAKRFSSACEFAAALGDDATSGPVKQPTGRKIGIAAAAALVIIGAAAGWWERVNPSQRLSAEAQAFYQKGVDDIAAGAYFAATNALGEAAKAAPGSAQAHARLAEAWLGLDQAEKAGEEMLVAKRQNLSALRKTDRLQIEAIDLAITREYPAEVAKFEEMARERGGDADVAVELGRAYENAGRPDDAIRSYRRAAEGPEHNPAAWLRLGVLYAHQSNKTKSDEAFAQAERQYQLTSSNWEGLTQVSLEQGIAAGGRRELNAAAAYLEKALERARLADNLQQEIAATLRLSTNAYQSGDADAAERYASEALAAARSHQLDMPAIRALISLGNALRLKQDFTGTERYYREALELGRHTQSGHLTALSLLSLAGLHDQIKDHTQAVFEAQEALGFYKTNVYVREYQQCLTVMVRAQRDSGDYNGALASSRSLLESAERTGDHGLMASAHESIGRILSQQQNYPGALDEFRKSLEKAADQEQVGYAAFNCGDTLWRLGQYAEAAAMFAKADGIAEKFRPLRLDLLSSRAEMALSQARFREAASLARRAQAADFSPTPGERVGIEDVLGLALAGAGDKGQGLKECEKAWSAAAGISDAAEKMDAAAAVLETRIESGERDAALRIFHEIEPRLAAFPELRWRALALASRADPRYLKDAREALEKISFQWGKPVYTTYLTRPDAEKLSRPLLRPVSAIY